MLTPEDVSKLLADIESDRIERTISTTNTDKFGQAICAFANDLPNHNRPGYLIIGADDKTGKVNPNVKITDQLLQNLGGIKTDGKLQPQVSMTVEKVRLQDGEVAVVTVQPCQFTPVRYEGRIWIRNGPRKCIASESDEKLLLEKRTSRMLTFDALPCFEATIEDLDLIAFKQIYLPKAFPEDILRCDTRSVEQQLQALGYFNLKYNCPTYAGIIMFGHAPERFMAGCYVQYVRFGGLDRAAEIKREYKFSGNLVKILSQLDTFVDTSITNRRPVPVSALREEVRFDYPHWATRELLMNAICHRDYEGNGPVQFYQYDDRIEIMNPGGLYGKATPENFPYVNDYRNGVVAEGMKVLGFVNRYSRGVQSVQNELRNNGNGRADFKLHLGTAFLVIEPISLFGNENHHSKPNKEKVEKSNKQVTEVSGKQNGSNPNKEKVEKSNKHKNEKPNKEKKISIELELLLEAIKENPQVTYKDLMTKFSMTYSTLYERLKMLKKQGRIARVGGRFAGLWQIIK